MRLSAHGPAWLLSVVALVAVLAEKKSITLTQSPTDSNAGLKVSVALLPLLFVAVAFGPPCCCLVGALTMVTPLSAVCSGGRSGPRTEPSSSGAKRLVQPRGSDSQPRPSAQDSCLDCSGSRSTSLDVLLASLVVVVRGSGSPREMVRAMAPVGWQPSPSTPRLYGLLALRTCSNPVECGHVLRARSFAVPLFV